VVGLAVAFASALLVAGARSASEASGLIAFTREDGVYVMHTDGSGVRQIHRRNGMPSGVAWSPDGRLLAFGTYDNGVWVMNADGSGRLRVAGVNAISRPSWSPDGRKIAFAAYPVRPGLWIVNADGSNLRRLTTPRLVRLGSVITPDWSPTGGRIAFSTAGWVPDIYVIDTKGSDLRRLTPGAMRATDPDWSPDGGRIVFTRDPGMAWARGKGHRSAEIYVMDASGHSLVRLTSTKVRILDQSPDWSPDGRRITFVRYDWKQGPGFGEIYAMKADRTGLTRLTHNRIAEGSPAWQPVAAP
jgi:Tol biopolymer transport system component